MKVHRIITTIEVENDNSITSIELTKLSLDDIRHPLVITNLTTNGSANDIKQVYDSIDKCRLAIAIKLKSIVRIIDDGIICINAYDDKYDNEPKTDGLI